MTLSGEPRAIAMWDFSWLERRWTGAGYEDWEGALDELGERGYNAVRIDAYPHFVADTSRDFHEVLPVWNQHDWGSPVKTGVEARSGLIDFVRAARDRGIGVGLSTWFRDDLTHRRMQITTPEVFADIWISTLRVLEAQGLLDAVWYVDLCNEWPHPLWAPFLYDNPGVTAVVPSRLDPIVSEWALRATARIKAVYPSMPLTLSIADGFDEIDGEGVAHLDFLEPHMWMADGTPSGFYEELGYVLSKARFEGAQLDLLRKRAGELYEEDRSHWQSGLAMRIASLADWSRAVRLPLITTECWATVIWKDGPGLDWGWVKELCAFGVHQAIAQKRWVGIATSNFCGPQFQGMWDDIQWHRELTDAIRRSRPDPGCTLAAVAAPRSSE